MRSCGCPLGRGNDVGHKVSVNPGDDAGVHVCHLKRYGYLRVLRYVSVDDLSHHQDQANDGQNKWNHFHLMHLSLIHI